MGALKPTNNQFVKLCPSILANLYCFLVDPHQCRATNYTAVFTPAHGRREKLFSSSTVILNRKTLAHKVIFCARLVQFSTFEMPRHDPTVSISDQQSPFRLDLRIFCTGLSYKHRSAFAILEYKHACPWAHILE